MEWNIKTPSQWDWDNNLMIFNGKASEISKQVQPADWGIEGDGGIDSGSFYSSGGVGYSGSDIGNGSSSKSSISASIDSSAKGGTKISEFNFGTVELVTKGIADKKEFVRVEDTGTSPTLGRSVVSGEPLIGLKLGKRTYFEDVCGGNTVKPSAAATNPTSSSTTVKRSRASYQSTQTPRCQVEGCNLDLTPAKDYHRRHRVCEDHSKSPRVVVAGLERRFCQQCSRFHDIKEFDEKKRSCRRRLSDHNARRRKPTPEAIQFGSGSLPSLFYDGREQMNLLLNRAPPVHTRHAANPVWESVCRFKPAAKGLLMRPATTESADGMMQMMQMRNHNLPKAVSTICHDSDRLVSFKSTNAEVLGQGLEAPNISSNLDTTLDFRRALSLLSTTSWRPGEPEATSMDQLMHANVSMTHSTTHAVQQGWSFASSEYWQAEQPTESQVHSLTPQFNGDSQFQEFQLLKSPHESGYYSNQMN